MKKVDTKEYIGVLRELTEEGRQVSLIIAGNSMAPFLIHGRDTVWFEKPKTPLKKGDIVFFQRDDGSFILHRIRRVHRNILPEKQKGENGYPPDVRNTYDMIGDAQLETECGIRRDQIFAIVFRVERKGKIIGPGDFWWLFLSGCGFGPFRSGLFSERFMEQCSPERDRARFVYRAVPICNQLRRLVRSFQFIEEVKWPSLIWTLTITRILWISKI